MTGTNGCRIRRIEGLYGHTVGDLQGASLAPEVADEDVGVLLVSTPGEAPALAVDLERAALVAIEDPREKGWGIESWEARPFDGAVGSDQGGRVAIPDEGEVADPIHELIERRHGAQVKSWPGSQQRGPVNSHGRA
jgi:hypothetical protein